MTFNAAMMVMLREMVEHHDTERHMLDVSGQCHPEGSAARSAYRHQSMTHDGWRATLETVIQMLEEQG